MNLGKTYFGLACIGCLVLLCGCVETIKGQYYNLRADQLYYSDQKQQSFEMYYQSAQNGVADSQYMVAQMLLSGEGVSANSIEGMGWLEKAAQQDHVEAARDMGLYLLDGAYGRQKDPQRGVWFLERAAAGNDAYSMLALGYIYFTAGDVPRNPQKAAYWFGQAAQNGETVPPQWQDAAYLAAAAPPPPYNANAVARARVKRAQSGLKALGYYKSSIDGLAGPGTASAVKKFQQDQGLEANGQIDLALMRNLYRCIVFDPMNRQM